MPEPGEGTGTGREPAATACLERTRSAVLNVLIVVGAGIAISGWVLGRHDPDAVLPWGLERTQRAFMATLLVLGVFAYLLMRVGSGREALRDPARRASRFFRSRVGAAGVAALAVPLGFAHGWLIDPRLQALAPFWIAALGLGFLALPRGTELDDFEEPIPGP
jgi:hypothetical protein